MNDFKQQYYIINIPWQRNINYDKMLRFESIRYTDTIIFHYDVMQSIFKVANKKGYDKTVFVTVINACLRYYKIIRTVYPYNKLYVVIHLKNNILLTYDAFKSIIDLIPNFAIVDNDDVLFDEQGYKHIFYGNCGNSKYQQAEKQVWSVVMGKLLIK